MSSPSERRKEVRISFQAPLELQWRSEQWAGSGTVINMSHTGCYVMTQKPALAGERIFIRPGADLPEIECVVRRVSPQVGMGVEFVGLTREAEQKVAAYLKAKAMLWA